MKTLNFLAAVPLVLLLSACATIKGGADVDQGRQALLEGDYQRALALFQSAEEADPNYVYGTELRAGVASYLGRTQYLTGNYAQARRTLQTALAQHKSDNVARLYLGLTLYRLGDQKAALANIQGSMKGISDWLDYLNTNFRFTFGKDWDPSGSIRTGIKKDLAMISSGNIQWPQLVGDGERLGIGMEEEEENFRRNEIDRHRRTAP